MIYEINILKIILIILLIKNIPYGFAVDQQNIYNHPEFFKEAKSLVLKLTLIILIKNLMNMF